MINYEPELGEGGWVFYCAPGVNMPDVCFLPKELYKALSGGILVYSRTYPTRAAALAALAEARAKAGGRHPQFAGGEWWNVPVEAIRLPRNEPEEAECERLAETVIGVVQREPFEPSGLGMRRIIGDLFRQVAAKATAAAKPDVNAELLAACEALLGVICDPDRGTDWHPARYISIVSDAATTRAIETAHAALARAKGTS